MRPIILSILASFVLASCAPAGDGASATAAMSAVEEPSNAPGASDVLAFWLFGYEDGAEMRDGAKVRRVSTGNFELKYPEYNGVEALFSIDIADYNCVFTVNRAVIKPEGYPTQTTIIDANAIGGVQYAQAVGNYLLKVDGDQYKIVKETNHGFEIARVWVDDIFPRSRYEAAYKHFTEEYCRARPY